MSQYEGTAHKSRMYNSELVRGEQKNPERCDNAQHYKSEKDQPLEDIIQSDVKQGDALDPNVPNAESRAPDHVVWKSKFWKLKLKDARQGERKMENDTANIRANDVAYLQHHLRDLHQINGSEVKSFMKLTPVYLGTHEQPEYTIAPAEGNEACLGVGGNGKGWRMVVHRRYLLQESRGTQRWRANMMQKEVPICTCEKWHGNAYGARMYLRGKRAPAACLWRGKMLVCGANVGGIGGAGSTESGERRADRARCTKDGQMARSGWFSRGSGSSRAEMRRDWLAKKGKDLGRDGTSLESPRRMGEAVTAGGPMTSWWDVDEKRMTQSTMKSCGSRLSRYWACQVVSQLRSRRKRMGLCFQS
ncbi:hypothetical protein B0H19DRAFT_1078061 [Mycena capillaripes]|nr:hypothetical protein B0H19DRAFT_1078061 [Mycena capillaripes]